MKGNIIEQSDELIRRARQGDQDAFTELYTRSSPALYRSIRSMVRDEELAWDIQQTSYLRAFQKLDSLKDANAFLPWLRRIAVNVTAREMAQKQPLTFTDLEEDGEPYVIPETRAEFQPELHLDRQETARLVQEILGRLSPEQRMVMGMFYYEDMSIPEISDTLHITQGTVKTNLHRGRKKVEAEVRTLEQQGLKLYGLSPLGFLLALLGRQEPAADAQTRVLQTLLAKTAELGTPSVPLTASPMRSRFFLTAAGKLTAGLLGLALTGAAVFGIVSLLGSGNNATLGDYQPSDSAYRLTVSDHSDGTHSETLPADLRADSDAPLSGSCGKHLSWSFDPDTGTLTIEGSGAMEAYHDDLSDPGVLAPWNNYSKAITTVILPDGLTTIGRNAFYDCNYLKSICIPTSVVRIDELAFQSCGGLLSITIPEGVSEIGAGAFRDCRGLRQITIPNTVTVIEQELFYGCRFLTSVTLPDSVTEIRSYAFSGCHDLCELNIPKGLTELGAGAFMDCASLTEFSIPDNATLVSENTFYGCRSLTSMTIPDGVTAIGNAAFAGCSALTSMTIPEGVTELGDSVFLDCSRLASVTIPDGITELGSSVFYGCSALTDVTIPAGVTAIGSAAFECCSSLTSITLPEGVTDIPIDAFLGCISLTSVTIPDKVTNVGSYAFASCNALTSVTIPDKVTHVGGYAFAFCNSLTSVTISEGVTSIDGAAFSDCSSLTSVTIPDSVTEIGVGAFGQYWSSETGLYEIVEGFTIRGSEGSAAQRYAEENGFSFVPLD